MIAFAKSLISVDLNFDDPGSGPFRLTDSEALRSRLRRGGYAQDAVLLTGLSRCPRAISNGDHFMRGSRLVAGKDSPPDIGVVLAIRRRTTGSSTFSIAVSKQTRGCRLEFCRRAPKC